MLGLDWRDWLVILIGSLVGVFISILFAISVRAQDWKSILERDYANPEDVRFWFQSLKMPDHPATSCCGEADAYWADSFEASPNGEYIAIITDERSVPNRQAREIGTKITVPNFKIKFDQGNPTGHGVIFLRPGSNDVYCYVPPGGV